MNLQDLQDVFLERLRVIIKSRASNLSEWEQGFIHGLTITQGERDKIVEGIFRKVSG